jgi:hypothetical protein
LEEIPKLFGEDIAINDLHAVAEQPTELEEKSHMV